MTNFTLRSTTDPNKDFSKIFTCPVTTIFCRGVDPPHQCGPHREHPDSHVLLDSSWTECSGLLVKVNYRQEHSTSEPNPQPAFVLLLQISFSSCIVKAGHTGMRHLSYNNVLKQKPSGTEQRPDSVRGSSLQFHNFMGLWNEDFGVNNSRKKCNEWQQMLDCMMV